MPGPKYTERGKERKDRRKNKGEGRSRVDEAVRQPNYEKAGKGDKVRTGGEKANARCSEEVRRERNEIPPAVDRIKLAFFPRLRNLRLFCIYMT